MTKFTITDFNNYKQNQRKITMVTAYDFLSAQLLEAAGVDIILVGDSLGMVVKGDHNTLSVSIDDMLYHTKAVRRGAPDSFIVADMPYLSYHTDINTTIQNAGKLICQGMANAVKLEINHLSTLKHIEALIAAQIPVVGHLGMTPQSVNIFGGFKVQGKTDKQATHITMLAKELEEKAISAIVLECMPAKIAEEITHTITIPTIGIGAGINCDGQVLVFHDLLGITDYKPKFVKSYLNGRELIIDSLGKFITEVRNKDFPGADYSY